MDPEWVASTHEWVVVNKPPGWLVIAPSPSVQDSGREPAPVLTHWVQARLDTEGPGAKVWIVHRIDQGTSGLVLFAKTKEAHRKANLWFETHQAKKIYLLAATGVSTSPSFSLNTLISGQEAQTQVRIVRQYPAAFLAEARIVTGRRHQIRIHLLGRGHPLLGDIKYKGPQFFGEWAVKRPLLHAWKLELPSGEKWEVPPPQDFTDVVDLLERSALTVEKVGTHE